MKEITNLTLEDLESVAGGYEWDELKESERTRLQELYDNWTVAKRSFKRGYVTQDDVDAAYNRLMAYHQELQREYDYRC
ncbi:MAG: hypothetical protein IJH64_06100 [Oscillospiraceae bacterium]|nr:hypothetical protein [Oscillospiraceae bacterium]